MTARRGLAQEGEKWAGMKISLRAGVAAVYAVCGLILI